MKISEIKIENDSLAQWDSLSVKALVEGSIPIRVNINYVHIPALANKRRRQSSHVISQTFGGERIRKCLNTAFVVG